MSISINVNKNMVLTFENLTFVTIVTSEASFASTFEFFAVFRYAGAILTRVR